MTEASKPTVSTSEAQPKTKRRRKRAYTKRADPDAPQQVLRIPPYQPGVWVKLKEFDSRDELSGAVKRIKSLTTNMTEADVREKKELIWRVHFDEGRALDYRKVERLATEAEI